MEAYIIVIIVVWLISSFAVAKAGHEREIGFMSTLVASIFLSPILAMLLVLSSKRYARPVNTTVKIKPTTLLKVLVPLTVLLLIGAIIKSKVDEKRWEEHKALLSPIPEIDSGEIWGEIYYLKINEPDSLTQVSIQEANNRVKELTKKLENQ